MGLFRALVAFGALVGFFLDGAFSPRSSPWWGLGFRAERLQSKLRTKSCNKLTKSCNKKVPSALI